MVRRLRSRTKPLWKRLGEFDFDPLHDLSCKDCNVTQSTRARKGKLVIFVDRSEAGRSLAWRLGRYADRDDVLVLGVPRGGVPVAFEVANTIHAPLDVIVLRKLGAPGHEEFAFGAIASGDTQILDLEVLRRLGLSPRDVDAVIAREREELLRREEIYRRGLPPLQVAGKTTILIDDGVATGSSLHAGIHAIRRLAPAKLVVAVPVSPPDTCKHLADEVEEVVCVATPENFRAVGQFYDDFREVTDTEVTELLARNREAAPSGYSGNESRQSWDCRKNS